MRRNWKKEIRKACESLKGKTYIDEVKVGNILIRLNVYADQEDPLMMQAGAIYIIPRFRLMYKDENHWFGNCSTIERVIDVIQEKLDFKVYE